MGKYIAVLSESAFSGLGIVDIQYGVEDYCIVEYFSPNGVRRTKNKIYMDSQGNSFIKKFNKRYYLNQFLRVGA